MTKHLLTSITLLCMIFLASCSSSGPEQVARKFIDSVNAGDFEEAKKYATTDTKSMLSMMESFGIKDQLADATDNEKENLEIISTTVSGDTAISKITSGEDGDDEMDIHLIKKDGEWLVDMTKESMDKEGMDDMDKETGNPDFDFDFDLDLDSEDN